MSYGTQRWFFFNLNCLMSTLGLCTNIAAIAGQPATQCNRVLALLECRSGCGTDCRAFPNIEKCRWFELPSARCCGRRTSAAVRNQYACLSSSFLPCLAKRLMNKLEQKRVSLGLAQMSATLLPRVQGRVIGPWGAADSKCSRKAPLKSAM